MSRKISYHTMETKFDLPMRRLVHEYGDTEVIDALEKAPRTDPLSLLEYLETRCFSPLSFTKEEFSAMIFEETRKLLMSSGIMPADTA